MKSSENKGKKKIATRGEKRLKQDRETTPGGKKQRLIEKWVDWGGLIKEMAHSGKIKRVVNKVAKGRKKVVKTSGGYGKKSDAADCIKA